MLVLIAVAACSDGRVPYDRYHAPPTTVSRIRVITLCKNPDARGSHPITAATADEILQYRAMASTEASAEDRPFFRARLLLALGKRAEAGQELRKFLRRHSTGNDQSLNRLIGKRDFRTVFANLRLPDGGSTDEVIAARPLMLRGLAEGRRGNFRSAINWFNCSGAPVGSSQYLYYPALAYLALSDAGRAASYLFESPRSIEGLAKDSAARNAGIMLSSSIFTSQVHSAL